MMELSNLSIAKQFSEGNFPSACTHFSEDIEWNIVGNQVVKGKIATIEFCTNMMVEMASSALTNNNCIESENQIVIEGKCRYFDIEGTESFVHYCDIYFFQNSKIKQITSYCI